METAIAVVSMTMCNTGHQNHACHNCDMCDSKQPRTWPVGMDEHNTKKKEGNTFRKVIFSWLASASCPKKGATICEDAVRKKPKNVCWHVSWCIVQCERGEHKPGQTTMGMVSLPTSLDVQISKHLPEVNIVTRQYVSWTEESMRERQHSVGGSQAANTFDHTLNCPATDRPCMAHTLRSRCRRGSIGECQSRSSPN
jgi:hypothetical protein